MMTLTCDVFAGAIPLTAIVCQSVLNVGETIFESSTVWL